MRKPNLKYLRSKICFYKRLKKSPSAVALVFAMAFCAILCVFSYLAKLYTHSIVLYVLLGISLFATMLAHDLASRYFRYVNSIFAFDKLQSAEVGVLIDCLNFLGLRALDFEIDARQKLIQILPEMQPDESMNLNAAQWRKLYMVLRGDDAHLIMATLEALKNAGNADALVPVRAIAEGKSPAGQNEALRYLARRCLPAIEERAAQSKNVSTLLRATNAPAISGDTLLRPASSSVETPPEQLLRASSSKEGI